MTEMRMMYIKFSMTLNRPIVILVGVDSFVLLRRKLSIRQK